MANLALIRGAAMAAPKFTDIRAAVEPGIRRLEQIAAIRQREEEKRELNDKREEALDAQAYNQLPALMTDGIPEAWQGYYTEQAMLLKDESYALAQNRRNMKPIEFIDAQRKLSTKIGKMQEAVNWIKTYAAEEKADVDEGLERSDSYTEDERELHFKILNMDPSIVPTMMDDQPAIQYTTDEGEVITKKLTDIERPQRKEYIKDNEIQNDLNSFLGQAAKAGKFPGDPEFDNLLEAKINSIELNKHEARSLAIDVFGIGGKRGQDAALIPALQPGIIEQFDTNQDGQIDKDEYLTFINSIKSIDELKNIVKDQYKQSAIATADKYKEVWEAEQEKIKQAQAAKKGGFSSKWEYEAWLEGQEKRAMAGYIKPLQEFLPNTPINEQQALELVSYANNKIPNIEIYQNPETNDEGELIAPNNYIIEVNGKQKFFEIDKTPGSSILKYIQDLYGYNTMERASLFSVDKQKESDEFAKYETSGLPTEEDINKILEEERTKDSLGQLGPTGAAEKARARIQKEQAGF